MLPIIQEFAFFTLFFTSRIGINPISNKVVLGPGNIVEIFFVPLKSPRSSAQAGIDEVPSTYTNISTNPIWKAFYILCSQVHTTFFFHSSQMSYQNVKTCLVEKDESVK